MINNEKKSQLYNSGSLRKFQLKSVFNFRDKQGSM